MGHAGFKTRSRGHLVNRTGTVPPEWKQATVIPIPKPGSHYRPRHPPGALRIALSALNYTPGALLEEEAGMLPLDLRRKQQSINFWARA
ncbi:hypothetical protein DPMN_043946 [Dreissena polymorpha]|uniref:Uncharacterized protein n=1 Tax=Dreissena polymorpha TaxID=45954 RepID=A0A9D4HYE1_DREPO|nr:hypothetical protein DPMN_043946 [Dreissena polymorpha]